MAGVQVVPLSQTIVLPPRIFCPKMIVQIICLARKLRVKVKHFHAKFSSSRSLSTLQLRGAFQSSCVFYFRGHTYNYMVNGHQAIISPQLGNTDNHFGTEGVSINKVDFSVNRRHSQLILYFILEKQMLIQVICTFFYR